MLRKQKQKPKNKEIKSRDLPHPTKTDTQTAVKTSSPARGRSRTEHSVLYCGALSLAEFRDSATVWRSPIAGKNLFASQRRRSIRFSGDTSNATFLLLLQDERNSTLGVSPCGSCVCLLQARGETSVDAANAVFSSIRGRVYGSSARLSFAVVGNLVRVAVNSWV